MEKKTLGSFLSVLRKAKGMTQKELAELLNVSDKAVSRWERDESMPDILLIPVLADIFEVSCDELLKGERTVKEHYQETAEKRTQRTIALLKKSQSKFQAFSMISVGVAVLGFIVAIVLNFSFHKATIGFYCALIGVLAGGISLGAFYVYFKSDVDTEEFSGQEFTNYRKYIRDHTLHIYYFLGVILCICLPLLFLGQMNYADYIAAMNEQMEPAGYDPIILAPDSIFAANKIAVGLQPKTWFLYGGIGTFVGIIVIVVINIMIKLQDAKKNRFGVTSEDVEKIKHTVKYFSKYVLILIILLGGTYVCSKIFEARMPDALYTGREFDNFDDFKEYMEKVPNDMYPGVVEIRQELDKYKGTVYGDDGELLCEYRKINDTVVDIEFGENNKLPVTVYSEEDLEIAKQKTEDLMWIWTVAMIAEGVLVAGIYVRNFYKKKRELL